MTAAFWVALIASLLFLYMFDATLRTGSQSLLPLLRLVGAIALVAWLIFIPWFALHSLGIDLDSGRTTP
ncbi:hypothetical protein [Nocardia wallacei]|uniref:hypothetical protein n=1 Tax=Nocardia wallacei TaxID=480035 RepID=UPI002454FD61|nr:hypothetical protein [Nocardia wallacei]